MCTEMSVQGDLLQKNTGNKLKVRQQKAVKRIEVNPSWASLGSTRQLCPPPGRVPQIDRLWRREAAAEPCAVPCERVCSVSV